jgi:Glycosyltransferases involved in cell wall biogenesis
MNVSIVVPTFNEAPNIATLVRRIHEALPDHTPEVVFVDDSTDDTADVIRAVAAESAIPVRLIHRDSPIGGLAGAVRAGLEASSHDWCVVMDGDLQHPPEMIPALLTAGVDQDAGVVVASRHVPGGSSAGLSNVARRVVSDTSNTLARAMFPIKLRNCTDPMTGFFALRRSRVDLTALRPRGFKILLEILARNAVKVVEEPFVFGERLAGESKASLAQGLTFLVQLAALRFGRLSGFAVIGALGAVANLIIMAALQATGVWYLASALIAGVVTIIANFLLQERFVFHDMLAEGHSVWLRFAQSLLFNGSETTARLGLLWVVVEFTPIPSVPAQGVLLGVGFLLRFVYHSRIVYRPRRTTTMVDDLVGFDVESVESVDVDDKAA